MSRITDKDLEAVAARINRATNSPTEYTTPQPDGRFHSNIGHYCIDHAYGGVCLHRVCTTGGGVSNVLGCGHVPKRELYERMHAYLRGLDDAKGAV